jgi:hypothetical protein
MEDGFYSLWCITMGPLEFLISREEEVVCICGNYGQEALQELGIQECS